VSQTSHATPSAFLIMTNQRGVRSQPDQG